MEKVQKKCVEIQPKGQDNYGNNQYGIKFEDGVYGFFGSKSEQTLFTVGAVSEFYLDKRTGKTGSEYYKILKVENVEKDVSFQGKKSEKSSKYSEKFMCLSYAKDIYIAFWDNKSSTSMVPNPTEITAYAEILYSETVNGKEEKKEEDTDVLPF